MRNYLLIANERADSPELQSWALEAVATDRTRCHFHVVVPAARVEHRFTWTVGEARAAARRRLDQVVARLRSLGAVVTGEVGDESPVLAARDALGRESFDAVVVSAIPPGASRWLHTDVVSRLRRALDLPVLQVAA